MAYVRCMGVCTVLVCMRGTRGCRAKGKGVQGKGENFRGGGMAHRRANEEVDSFFTNDGQRESA